MSALYLTRARLRQDASLAALAPVLLPADAHARTGMAHRLIWSLFADTADRRRDFLWREDAPGQFMTLSARPPEDERLFALEVKPFAPVLLSGDRLRFLLRANPTIDHAEPGHTRRSRRSDVVMDALKPVARGEARQQARPQLIQQAGAEWLRRVGDRHGFIPETILADGYDQLRLPRPAGKRPIQISTLDFAGVLEVTDVAAFLAQLAQGFGRARGFGCGLMLIRRA